MTGDRQTCQALSDWMGESVITLGIVEVACLAACVSRVEVVTITSTPSRRNPVTNSGRRSGRPSPAAPRSDHEVAAFHVAELTHGLEKSAPHDFVRGDGSHREEADGDKPSLLAAPWRERAPSRDQKRCRR